MGRGTTLTQPPLPLVSRPPQLPAQTHLALDILRERGIEPDMLMDAPDGPVHFLMLDRFADRDYATAGDDASALMRVVLDRHARVGWPGDAEGAELFDLRSWTRAHVPVPLRPTARVEILGQDPFPQIEARDLAARLEHLHLLDKLSWRERWLLRAGRPYRYALHLVRPGTSPSQTSVFMRIWDVHTALATLTRQPWRRIDVHDLRSATWPHSMTTYDLGLNLDGRYVSARLG